MEECSAILKIKSEVAETLYNAIEPDNLVTPKNVKVKCHIDKDKNLICKISIACRDVQDILRLRNTLDDLISSIKTSLSVLKALKGLQREKARNKNFISCH
jgi:tRNA threonylcarbamoyladenosine modification (KEOPS) complex  Pcc1 subunit